MKFLAITSALLAVPSAVTAAIHPFTGMALRSASPIHFASLEARSDGLWLWGKTKTFCPEEVGDACPKGKTTSLYYGEHRLSMGAMVPGGQQVYITKTGRVGYTQPHSASMPAGSTTTGWIYRPKYFDFGSSKADQLSHRKGLVACEYQNSGTYQLYVQVPGFSKKGCLGFDFVAQNVTKPTAWEYL